ncbi:hypothetical protein GCM10022383_08840 [Microbacterium soli]|uniref:Uncharacterized protein n=1 Tax=Microbacterium soli TaxID=446075 RepID=A0ABP7MXZ7_9MICO
MRAPRIDAADEPGEKLTIIRGPAVNPPAGGEIQSTYVTIKLVIEPALCRRSDHRIGTYLCGHAASTAKRIGRLERMKPEPLPFKAGLRPAAQCA